MLAQVLNDIRVARLGGGRPHTRPDVVLADKAHGSAHNRLRLRARGIATRYDKLAITYRAGAVLHAYLTWATLLGDTP